MSDSIPAWLSNGEHVLTAEDVADMGGQNAVYAFREGLKDGKARYADGGAVASPVFVSSPPVMQTESHEAASVIRQGDRWYISSPADPTAVAHAVERRRNMKRV
jgi:hypothetical protein